MNKSLVNVILICVAVLLAISVLGWVISFVSHLVVWAIRIAVVVGIIWLIVAIMSKKKSYL